MNDELQAALARAKAAEAEVKKAKRYATKVLLAFCERHFDHPVIPMHDLICLISQIDNASMRADEYKRQRDEEIAASDARAAAMREMCAAKAYEFGDAFRVRNQNDYAQGYEAASDAISTAISALPIPAREVKAVAAGD